MWRDALAKALKGRTEVKVDGDRIDVLTDTQVIELDWPDKWQEGFGQILHYADMRGEHKRDRDRITTLDGGRHLPEVPVR